MMYYPPRTHSTLLFYLFTVELLLPSFTQQSAIEHSRADDAIQTDGLTTVFAGVISSGTNESTYGRTVRNQVKREKRVQLGEIMSQNNFSEFWNSNNTASISRWLEILEMLPKSVRLAFLTVIPSDEISVPDLLQLDSNTIAMLKNELSWLLTDKQVSDIIFGLLRKKDYRQTAQVIESLNLRINDGNPDFFLRLWNDQQFELNQRCSRDVQSFLRQGLRLLPLSDKWNNTQVKKYGFNLISALPPDILIRIRDRYAAKTILDWWLPQEFFEFGCDFPPDSPDSAISVKRVQLKLMMEVLGENISQWSTANISFYFSLFRRMSPRLLAMMNDQILDDSLSFLSQIKNWNDGQGYALVERLFTNGFRQRLSGDRLSNITDRLMYLGPYLLPEFLVNNKNTSAPALLLSIWASKMDSLVKRGIQLPRMTASALLQYRLSGMAEKNLNMTFQELPRQLDATYLNVAPWKLWKTNLAQSHSVTQDILQTLDAMALADSLSSGQINRLSAVAARVFRNSDDGSWSMANTPTIYWGGANLSDYMSLSVKEILPLINKFTSVVEDNLNGAQLGVIYTKLRVDRADLSSATNSARIIKSMIPVPYLKSRYTMNQLRDLATDMPIDSVIRLTYASTKLDGKHNITVADLFRQPFLVPHLSPEHLDFIPVMDTAHLMKAVSSSAQGPPIQTIKILQSRLRSYTRYKRHDIANTDVSLLENVWLSNFDIYPATVIADFNLEALKSMSEMKKTELLRSLGHLHLNDYYTIPRYKRIHILQQGIAAMVKNDNGRILNEEDMAIIGNAVVDMEGSRLNKMTAAAFEMALPILQGNAEIFGGLSARPCTTSDQRSAIRKSLKTFYGYPNAWDLGTVAVACCSLNTLSWRELESIRDDLFLEGCRGCNADIPPPFHLQILRQNLKAACQFELNSMELENDIRKGDQVQVFGIHNPNIFANESRRLSCEAVVPSGSAAGFTVDQLVSLSTDDIRDCLYELGYSPLNTDQGTALWNRILQVYENDASRIPKDQLTRLGWILPSVDMESLNKLLINDYDVLAALGTTDRKISIEKMKVLSNRAALEWEKDPKNYTGQDLIILGRLLCGMNVSLIDHISPIAYLEASAYLGMILCQPRCSDGVLSSLANKAIDYKVFGAPSNWTAAIVRNIGVVIGGLSPEQLRLIPASSLLGLTPSAVISIPDNNFEAFKTQQIRNLPLAVAQTILVRERQRYGLVDEMRDALNYVIYGSSDNSGNSSKRNTESGILFITAITFVIVRGSQLVL